MRWSHAGAVVPGTAVVIATGEQRAVVPRGRGRSATAVRGYQSPSCGGPTRARSFRFYPYRENKFLDVTAKVVPRGRGRSQSHSTMTRCMVVPRGRGRSVVCKQAHWWSHAGAVVPGTGRVLPGSVEVVPRGRGRSLVNLKNITVRFGGPTRARSFPDRLLGASGGWWSHAGAVVPQHRRGIQLQCRVVPRGRGRSYRHIVRILFCAGGPTRARSFLRL